MIRHTSIDGDNLSKPRSSQLVRTPIIHENVMAGVMPDKDQSNHTICTCACVPFLHCRHPAYRWGSLCHVSIRVKTSAKYVFLDASFVVRKSPLNWNYSKWWWNPAYGYSIFMQKRHPIKQEDLFVWVGCMKCFSYTHLPLQFTPTLGTVLCIR